MTTITIKNVGPIKEANFTLNKINVFMGPQSSGKSTIAKIISYCTWVEKRYLLDGEYKEDVNKQLLDFHHLSENYFDDNSCFEYESEFVKINYKSKKLKQEIKINEAKILDYKKTKNIYIPAERNFVSAIPNLSKYNETNDNIMSLIYDWFTAKKNFSKQKSLPILNFGIDYYYQKGADLDMLILNNAKKEIPLNTGSSGLQSITPLIIIFEYLSNIFYGEKYSLSVKEKDELNRLLAIMTKPRMGTFGLNDEESAFIQRREKYSGTLFIIEEPEQNLFPETQRDLVYYLLERLQSEREHTLTITTHSPYILYALNNCMLGYLVKGKMIQDEDYVNLQTLKSVINPTIVSVWQITTEGTIKDIQGEDRLIEENYFDACMKNVMDDYYKMINYYGDEDED